MVRGASVWARALGLSNSPSSRSAVSKALRRLEDLALITRVRAGNRTKVVLCREDGSGEVYVHPSQVRERYLKVSYDYWRKGWHHRLSLRGKVVLLIGLSLNEGFILPQERGPDWYGISADTVQRGLHELIEHELLGVESIRKKAPLAPEGFTLERHYTLHAPFKLARAKKLATVTRLPA